MSQSTLVEKVRERVLQLAREIEALSRSEAPPEEFFPQFLDKLVRALGADAGVVWMLEQGQRLGLKAETGLDATGFRENPNAVSQNHALLVDSMSTGQAAVYVPGETDKPLPTQHQIVVAALQTGSDSVGVVEIFQRAGAPKEARPGYLQFVEQMCGYASKYLERQKKRAETPAIVAGAVNPFLLEFGDFVLQMQRTLDVKEVCSTAASDGRLLLNCDRVSVVLKKGRKTFVQAISGQDSVNKRANLVRKMVDLAKAAIAMKEPIVYSGKNEPLPPQIETPLADFLQESKSRLVIVAPCSSPNCSSGPRMKTMTPPAAGPRKKATRSSALWSSSNFNPANRPRNWKSGWISSPTTSRRRSTTPASTSGFISSGCKNSWAGFRNGFTGESS